jgi:2-polyprenyl-3-methyl-5-hydroxy-6-metoxy-1,4-benzoquinol methylase
MKTCRVCGHTLYDKPLLRYTNMPRAAQFLPDLDSLDDDKGVDLEVCQCSGCGLVQLNSDPVPYHKDVIRAAAFSDEMKNFRTRQFHAFVQKYHLKKKKVIEIGCGRGEYLSLMMQTEVDGYGVEHLGESVKHCLKHGMKVMKGFIDDASYQIDNSPFDAFFMLNFLEHVPEPNSILRCIYNNVTDGAVGLVEVPNFDMIMNKSLFSEFIPDHLCYFTKDTLTTILTINGYDILECNEIWHDYIISALIRKRSSTNLLIFHENLTKIHSELYEFISIFGHKKVAIWGAGHQAFAVMSLTNLSDKIKYVVDSAVFKQGKYTPATHIPIVSPETLNSDPVDAVIVMAASYSDEVAMILRRDFDRKMNIAILRDYGLEYLENHQT